MRQLLVITLLLAYCGSVQAADGGHPRLPGAGDTFVQVGWLHIQSLDKSQPMHTVLQPNAGLNLLGVDTDFYSPGTGASLNNINTVAFVMSHAFTNHIYVKMDAGIPTIFQIRGTGIVQPTSKYPLIQNSGLLPSINLGEQDNNPLATARQWSPAVIAQYFFFSPTARFRPNLGIGISYTWFTDISPNATFENQLNTKFGSVLSLLAGKYSSEGTHITTKASYNWAPVYNAGFIYSIDRHWGIVGSLSYLPLHATAHISIFAADGSQLSDSSAAIHLDPLVSAVLLSYRF